MKLAEADLPEVLSIVLGESDIRSSAVDRARVRLRQGPVGDLELADRIMELDLLFHEFTHALVP